MLINDIQNADAITHGGVFHADEVFATVLLHKLHPQWLFFRAGTLPDTLPPEKLVYDIGGGAFDHHRRECARQRSNGIQYSSFGLLWQAFGRQLLAQLAVAAPEAVFAAFDQSFVAAVDAQDTAPQPASAVPTVSVSQVISAFNPQWNEPPDFDAAFERAAAFAEVIFDNALRRCIAEAEAEQAIQEALQTAAEGMLILPRYIPWKASAQALLEAHAIRFVIYPSARGGFAVQSAGTAQEALFPAEWAGCDASTLVRYTGVKTISFCHIGRFLCCTGTLEDAVAIAKKATHSDAKNC